MAMTEDLSAFFDTEEFADEATITTDTDTLSVNGIYDSAYEEVFGSNGSSPTFLCVEVDVILAKKGDAVTVKSKDFRIASMKPDGIGLTALMLEAY